MRRTERALAAGLVLLVVLSACGPGRSDSEEGSASTDAADGSTGDDDSAVGTTPETGADLRQDGESCESDTECQSGICWITDIEGRCSECSTDDDCPSGGCTRPNFLAPLPDPIMAMCNAGQLGDQCTDDAACTSGLVCALVFDIPIPLVTREMSTCSECETDADCGAGTHCAPVYDEPNAAGHRACVEAGSVALGGGCDAANSGDEVCASGFCAVAETQDLGDDTTWPAFGGVCSECVTGADCSGGACLPAGLQFGFGDGIEISPAVCGS